jgi:hypothetical protein
MRNDAICCFVSKRRLIAIYFIRSDACGGFFSTAGVCHLVPIGIAANTQADANNTYYPRT